MRGYLTVPGSESVDIRVDSPVEVYWDQEDGQTIRAPKGQQEFDLGISDITVSRHKNGHPPAVINPQPSCLEVVNRGNTNGVTVVAGDTENELETGHLQRVRRDATVSLGYQTDIRLEIKEDPRTEVSVEGNVEENVVMGDDESTTVTDSVVNRSSIGSTEGSSGARVDDSVVNRSEVGTGHEYDDPATDTQPVPDDPATDTRPVPDNAPDTDDTSEPETKFCIYCGTSTRADASVCSSCGESQPET